MKQNSKMTMGAPSRRLLLASACATVALAGPTASLAGEQVVKVGVLAPITGEAAADGEEMVRGAELAVEEANESGRVDGFRFEVVVGDTEDQSSASVVSAIERLSRQSDLHVIVTGYASTSNFEIDYMADMEMPYILAAQSSQTRDIIAQDPDAYPTVWSYTPSYDAYETALPPVLDQIEETSDLSFDDRTVALITSDNPYSMTIYDGLKKSFDDAGWTVTVDETVPFGEVGDWRSTLSRIRQDPPDVIVNTDYLPGNGARFMRQFMENPTNSLMFIQYAPSVPEFLELTRDDSTGVIYNMLGAPVVTEEQPRGLEVLDAFEARWGTESGMYGVALYEMTHVYFDALEKVGDPADHLAIGEAIGQTDKQTASGRLVFDQETHLAKQGNDYFPIQFIQIWDGERTLFYPEEYAAEDFRIPPWMSAAE